MRVRYDPNNVLLLPMPQEKFQIVINTLVEKNFEEYDEAKEDERRASQSTKGIYRAFRLNYVYVDYNFYGFCSELYEAAASALQVDAASIDLFVQYKDEGGDVSLDGGINHRRCWFVPMLLRAVYHSILMPKHTWSVRL